MTPLGALLALVGLALIAIPVYRAFASERPTSGSPDAASPPADEALKQAVGAIDKKQFSLPAAAARYAKAIARAEATYGMPPGLLARQLDIESDHFAADVISGERRSRAGAIGIAQFLPATAAELGVDPTEPFQSIDGAGRYMRSLYNRFGDWGAALAAYNWGEGRVLLHGAGAAPPETKQYVALILGAIGST